MKLLALLFLLTLTGLAHADYTGTVSNVHTFKDGGIAINLDGKWPHSKMTLYIAPKNVAQFTALPAKGDIVTGIGKTIDYEGYPEIILEEPSQLKITPGKM